MRFKGIIFDLDGTLVDTEILHGQAWLSSLADFGLPQYDYKWFEQWIGKSDIQLAESVIAENAAMNIDLEALRAAKRNSYHDLAKEKTEVYPGVEELLRQLYHSHRLGIATNSTREDANAVFAATQLHERVHAHVTASDVVNLKPAPDMYLKAAQEVGLPVREGAAIEDSVAGSTAAKAAGLFTLGVTTSHSAEELGAVVDKVFPDTRTAIEWILAQ